MKQKLIAGAKTDLSIAPGKERRGVQHNIKSTRGRRIEVMGWLSKKIIFFKMEKNTY